MIPSLVIPIDLLTPYVVLENPLHLKYTGIPTHCACFLIRQAIFFTHTSVCECVCVICYTKHYEIFPSFSFYHFYKMQNLTKSQQGPKKLTHLGH